MMKKIITFFPFLLCMVVFLNGCKQREFTTSDAVKYNKKHCNPKAELIEETEDCWTFDSDGIIYKVYDDHHVSSLDGNAILGFNRLKSDYEYAVLEHYGFDEASRSFVLSDARSLEEAVNKAEKMYDTVNAKLSKPIKNWTVYCEVDSDLFFYDSSYKITDFNLEDLKEEVLTLAIRHQDRELLQGYSAEDIESILVGSNSQRLYFDGEPTNYLAVVRESGSEKIILIEPSAFFMILEDRGLKPEGDPMGAFRAKTVDGEGFYFPEEAFYVSRDAAQKVLGCRITVAF